MVGTKLEQVITLLATEVVRRKFCGVEDMKIKPSDHYFWFSKPKIIHLLIHFILSCNSFAIAFFFWSYVSRQEHAYLEKPNTITDLLD